MKEGVRVGRVGVGAGRGKNWVRVFGRAIVFRRPWGRVGEGRDRGGDRGR